MPRISTDILIVGGGAAGMSAAIAAAADSSREITLIDDNPLSGGQIWRSELGKIKSPDAKRLISKIEAGSVTVIGNVQIHSLSGPNRLLAESRSGRMEFEYKKLILATGARERFLPFPGWTLPNIFGAGGLQALVKGGLRVENKRVVVAGTGALLFAVAGYLRSKGADVAAIAEQAPASNVNMFAAALWRSPSKLLKAIRLKGKLFGVPYLSDCWVTSATGFDKLEAVELTRKRKRWSVECDYLACGFHLVPNIELASLLGCRIENGFVAVDEFQQTTCKDIFCAGEPTGIAGVEASLIEGTIAGLTACGETEKARSHFRSRTRTRKFGEALNRAFTLRDELKTLSDDATFVCRCEDVSYGRLKEFDSWRAAKLQTRCGMGACQGRVCGGATEFLFDWQPGTIRPPIFPVKLENL
jgi:NADPH-dependent 2,4-dienoyl-CoA reductase/sulfur reductase-like enzyme